MRLSRILCVFSVSLVFLPVLAFAQSFTLSQNGKPVGTATLAIKAAAVHTAAADAAKAGGKAAAGKTAAGKGAGVATGFDLSSEVKINMPGLDYSFTETEGLNAGYHLRKAQLNGLVNGKAATVSALRTGQQISLKIATTGPGTTTPLAFHAQSVFMPDFDPGSLQVLLKLAAAANNLDLWALIPKQTGLTSAVQITAAADEEGTLNGAPIAVHHLSVSTDTDKIELFSNAANELLQAEWTQTGFALARQGFVLKPAARPPAAPARPASAPVPQQPQK
jgi:hypothetical protein